MIRFYRGRNSEISYQDLRKESLTQVFQDDALDKIVCVNDGDGKYIGNITWKSLRSNEDIEMAICRDRICLDEDIWGNGEKYFRKQRVDHSIDLKIAVVDKDDRFLCFAYQDDDADTELRMLRELHDKDMLNFQDVLPEYHSVEIYGVNELAYQFVKYLNHCGIPVEVHGDMWEQLGIKGRPCYKDENSYVIYAEGTWQKSGSLYKQSLRSASVCFECIDKIYGSNVKAGKVRRTMGGENEFIDHLSQNRIAIIGTDAVAADVYDQLLGKGIQASYFVDIDHICDKKYMFNKPVHSCQEIFSCDPQVIFIECHGNDSRWGLNGVDFFDYHGYYRNEKYFFVRDYLKPVQGQLKNVIRDCEEIIMFGSASMCAYLRNQAPFTDKNVRYIDLLNETGEGDHEIGQIETSERRTCLFVCPELLYEDSRKYEQLVSAYRMSALNAGLNDYSDYFTKNLSYIGFERDHDISKRLMPRGIMLGAIDGNSGNILFNGVLDEHPNIVRMDPCYLKENMFSICLRLSQKHSNEILPTFWGYYKKEADPSKEALFCSVKQRFEIEVKKLLVLKERFTSQELFMIFHLGYIRAAGTEDIELCDRIIYWESHYSSREQMEKYADWLKNERIAGYIVNMTRHNCTRAGSYFAMCCRYEDILEKSEAYRNMLQAPNKRIETYDGYTRIVLSFEKTKMNQKEVTEGLCKILGIPWSEKMLSVTNHGNESVTRNGIKGFDIKPVFNQYDEYFSGYDKMRILLLTAPWQKNYGYPYVDCMDFTRYELQELMLKDFRFEKFIVFATQENERKYRVSRVDWLKKRMRVIYSEMQQQE